MSGPGAAKVRELVGKELLWDECIRPAGRRSIFGHGSAQTAWAIEFEGGDGRSAGMETQRDLAEQRLKRPAGGQVDTDAARRLANAGADFEQLGAQRFDLC